MKSLESKSPGLDATSADAATSGAKKQKATVMALKNMVKLFGEDTSSVDEILEDIIVFLGFIYHSLQTSNRSFR